MLLQVGVTSDQAEVRIGRIVADGGAWLTSIAKRSLMHVICNVSKRCKAQCRCMPDAVAFRVSRADCLHVSLHRLSADDT